ncbi:MAG: UDP-N-acetylmuramyl-tripeptide synthetase [Alphaproteobacteria bacterium]|jgi:UDP-N-acetylmuramyl-tripeptide synthetase/UDP-N-acetylmuramoyl-tripeptide--D-alanyl-D-alanine ligase
MMIKFADLYPNLTEDLKNITLMGVTADSRKVQQDFAFVVIKGEKHNGTAYIQSAIDMGATLIIAQDDAICADITVPVYKVECARTALSYILGVIYPNRPQTLYAVTGTNGKTSVADFIRQILAKQLKRSAVSLGTLGAVANNVSSEIMENMPFKIIHTTPDPETLYPTLDYLARNGVTDCIIEASSHGLSQSRLGDLKFDCVLFTNFSRDHLDYHGTEQAYFDAKMLLFTQHTHHKTQAIIFNDDLKAIDVLQIAKNHNNNVIRFGTQVDTPCEYVLKTFNPHNQGADFTLQDRKKKEHHFKTHLVGQFQAQNLLMAFIAIKAFHRIKITQKIIDAIETVDGRLDYIASANDAALYVDYAHTPDALQKALLALRPHCEGRLICVFGCGGNRDAGKRPIMGEIAVNHADIVIVTDDNPRNEDPNFIRTAVMAQINAQKSSIFNIADRRIAIEKALLIAKKDDIILVAGKGHENGQIICDKTLPFKDAEVIRQIINNQQYLKKSATTIEKRNMDNKSDNALLWTQAGVCATTGGSVLKPFTVTGIAIDSRDVKPGDLFIALKARRDGHYFIKNAAHYGAVAALVAWKPRNLPRGFPIVYVKNTLAALEKLAVAARNRMRGHVIAVTGTAGKTSTKEILLSILAAQGNTHASTKSFNNHIGVPLSLARMPIETQYGIFELGMNKAGEIRNLVKMVRPNVAIITTVGNGHRESFETIEDIAKAKAEVTESVTKGGTVILNRDIGTFSILQEAAQAHSLKVVTFGTDAESDVRLVAYSHNEEMQKSTLNIALHGENITVETGLKGDYNGLNICAILASLVVVNADIPQAISTLADLKPASGRGEIVPLTIPEKGEITLIDESYNANPLSMKGALQNMISVKPQNNGKKIAILGAMYELGDITEQAHIDLKSDIIAGNYDAIYLIGKEMSSLYDVLGDDQPAIHAEQLSDITDEIIEETTDGSVVMLKGSNGVKLWQLVTHFKQLGNYFADNISAEEDTQTDVVEAIESETPTDDVVEVKADDTLKNNDA